MTTPTNHICSPCKREIRRPSNPSSISGHFWLQYPCVWLLRLGLIQAQGLTPDSKQAHKWNASCNAHSPPLPPLLIYVAGVEKMGEEKGRRKWRLLASQGNLVIILSSFSSWCVGCKAQGEDPNSISRFVPVRHDPNWEWMCKAQGIKLSTDATFNRGRYDWETTWPKHSNLNHCQTIAIVSLDFSVHLALEVAPTWVQIKKKKSKVMFYLTSAQFPIMLLLFKPHEECSWLLKFASSHFKIKGVTQQCRGGSDCTNELRMDEEKWTPLSQ